VDYITPLLELAKVFAGLGLVTIALSLLKRSSEKRAWIRYKAMVRQWMLDAFGEGERHPNELNEVEWQAECEDMLCEAGFIPSEADRLLSTAVVVAKGIVNRETFSRWD